MADESANTSGAVTPEGTLTATELEAQSQQSQAAAAPDEGNQGKKIFGRFDTLEEAERGYKQMQAEYTRMRQSAKTSGKEVKDALLGGETATQGGGQQAQARQAEQYIAAQGGGSAEVVAYKNLAAQIGPEAAMLQVIQYYTKQAAQAELQAHLGPIQQKTQEAEMSRAFGALQSQAGMDPDEFWEKETPKIRQVLAARPKLREQLQKAETAQEMYELLDIAYTVAQKQSKATVAKAATAAGAKREQERSAMAAAASVESGRGAGTSGKDDPHAALKAAIRGAKPAR